uniref:CCHC-type domain-containing protein n=1 Tax=Cajanus cajan TaxID=3821 RepID=A0A151R4J8_CAJCA|nr:hypothetical protein KK1_041257 [Cajanus cajan]
MANSNLPYGEGVSIYRPPVFNGENNVYWKIRMRIFIEAIDIAVWDAIENGPYIPMTKDDDGKREKHWSEWSDDERKRAQYDCREKNIITSALSIDEENEQQDKKGKGVSLRALKSVKGKKVCEESSSEDFETENFNLLVKKFRKFLRKKRNSPYKFNKKANKKEEASTSSYNCFECEKPGHIKAECPNLLKKQQEEKKVKKNFKGKRAYTAWEDNDSSTTSDESEFEENNLCLMAGANQNTIECLRAKSLLWYLDSGCSRHMTGDPSKFSSLKLKNEGFVTHGDNNKGRILGHGNIGNSSSLTLIENVLFVEGLKHNFLSISQLSDVTPLLPQHIH